jgi:malonyl-CoA O-methyltransferase
MSTGLLSAREAYALWAPSYGAENVVTTIENDAVRKLTPPLVGKRLLDAGCGTARRLRELPRSAYALGVDLVEAMLRIAEPLEHHLAAADVSVLPLRSGLFDVVWCRLVLGHLERIDHAYAELARVARPGGLVVISDFHPEAVRAGHKRSFRTPTGEIAEVPHTVHEPGDHLRAAEWAGLQLRQRIDAAIGPGVQDLYVQAGALDGYERDLNLPVVLALAFAVL